MDPSPDESEQEEEYAPFPRGPKSIVAASHVHSAGTVSLKWALL